MEEIVNPYMDASVCRSGNAIPVCKYGMSSCHGDCFIIPGISPFCLVARQPSIITSKGSDQF